jgi:hypothetical protein
VDDLVEGTTVRILLLMLLLRTASYITGPCKPGMLCDDRLRQCRTCTDYDPPGACDGSCDVTRVYEKGKLVDQYCQVYADQSCGKITP